MSFKIAVIGCGHMAVTGHGPAYRHYAELHPEVELAACCDKNEAAAESFRQKFGFSRAYTDMDVMLDTEKPDAVCLIVPVHLTAELFIRICARGIPVITEKPPGLNGVETQRMIEAAERNGVPHQVAFNRRHMPMIRRLKQELAKHLGAEGLQYIQYDQSRVRRTDADFSTTAIHGIDTVRYLVGSDYKHVRFRYQDTGEPGSGVVNIFMDCEFESGVVAHLSFCPVSGSLIERAAIHGRNHTFHMQLPIWSSIDLPGKLQHLQNNELKLELSGAELASPDEGFVTNGFFAENASFFDDIRAGRRPVDDVRSGLQAVEIADCIRRRVLDYQT